MKSVVLHWRGQPKLDKKFSIFTQTYEKQTITSSDDLLQIRFLRFFLPVLFLLFVAYINGFATPHFKGIARI